MQWFLNKQGRAQIKTDLTKVGRGFGVGVGLYFSLNISLSLTGYRSLSLASLCNLAKNNPKIVATGSMLGLGVLMLRAYSAHLSLERYKQQGRKVNQLINLHIDHNILCSLGGAQARAVVEQMHQETQSSVATLEADRKKAVELFDENNAELVQKYNEQLQCFKTRQAELALQIKNFQAKLLTEPKNSNYIQAKINLLVSNMAFNQRNMDSCTSLHASTQTAHESLRRTLFGES